MAIIYVDTKEFQQQDIETRENIQISGMGTGARVLPSVLAINHGDSTSLTIGEFVQFDSTLYKVSSISGVRLVSSGTSETYRKEVRTVFLDFWKKVNNEV